MNETKRDAGRIKIYTLVSLLLSLGVIILILYFTFNAETLHYLTHTSIHYEYFAIAVLLNVISWFLWGLRVQVLGNALDKNLHLSLWEGTRIVIANLFLALITPALIGGEPLRIYLLKKDGMNLGGATAVILGERLIDAIWVLIAVPFAFYIFKDRLGDSTLMVTITIGVILFLGFLLVLLYALKNPSKIKSFLIFLNKKINRLLKRKEEADSSAFFDFVEREVDNFHSSLVFFAGEGKTTFFYVSFLTLAYWALCFMIPSMLLLGLGLPPYYLESYAAQMLLLIIVTIPTTPGSSGVAELSMSGLYSVLIGPSYGYLLGVFVFLFRFITYHINLIAGAVFQYRIFKSLTSFSFDILKK